MKLCVLAVQLLFAGTGEAPVPVDLQLNTQTCPAPQPILCTYQGKRTLGVYDARTFGVICYDPRGRKLFDGEASYPTKI